jgi:hypothetical protein
MWATKSRKIQIVKQDRGDVMTSKSEDEGIKENEVYAARIVIKGGVCEACGYVNT